MTTPLGGLPYPADLNASANGPAAFEALARATDPKLVNAFANVGARDSAYQAWVAAGNTMRDGLMCTVGGWPQVYRWGKWRGIEPGPFYVGEGPPTFGPWTIPIGDTSPRVIGRVTIADPGFTYRVRAFATAEIYACDANGNEVDTKTAGYRVDSKMELGGGAASWDLWRGDVGNLHKHSDVAPIELNGAQVVNFIAYRATGSSGYWKSTSLNFSFHLEVVPV